MIEITLPSLTIFKLILSKCKKYLLDLNLRKKAVKFLKQLQSAL
jgi:hypothetical protein